MWGLSRTSGAGWAARATPLAATALLWIAIPSSALGQSAIGFQYFYDDTGQLVKVVDSTGIVIEYVYDPVGNILEVKRTASAPGTLAVFSFTPGQGSPLTTVVIRGAGFGSTPAANAVTFDGAAATVLSAAGDTLVVSVPVAATTGPISVTVGGSTTASATAFVVSGAPVITSITPGLIDTTRPPATLQVTGINLTGATFSFLPAFQPPQVAIGAIQVNPEGTAATLSITVLSTARGRFTLVGANAAGSGDSIPNGGNSVAVASSQGEIDSDGDGFPDAVEVLFGSDPFDPSSKPDPNKPALWGEVGAPPWSVSNSGSTSTAPTVTEAEAARFSVVNSAEGDPASPIVGEADAAAFSVVNQTGGPLPTVTEAEAARFSVVNSAGGNPASPSVAEADAAAFSVVNQAGGPLASVLGEFDAAAFSVQNSSGSPVPTSAEANATTFSVLSIAGMTGGQPVGAEANALMFSVNNTALGLPVVGETTPGQGVGGIGSEGTGSGSGGHPIPMESNAVLFSVRNLATGALNGVLPDGRPRNSIGMVLMPAVTGESVTQGRSPVTARRER